MLDSPCVSFTSFLFTLLSMFHITVFILYHLCIPSSKYLGLCGNKMDFLLVFKRQYIRAYCFIIKIQFMNQK